MNALEIIALLAVVAAIIIYLKIKKNPLVEELFKKCACCCKGKAADASACKADSEVTPAVEKAAPQAAVEPKSEPEAAVAERVAETEAVATEPVSEPEPQAAPAPAEPAVQSAPETVVVSECSKENTPEDSMLKRHYLAGLSAPAKTCKGHCHQGPTDSMLRRHYEALKNSK